MSIKSNVILTWGLGYKTRADPRGGVEGVCVYPVCLKRKRERGRVVEGKEKRKEKEAEEIRRKNAYIRKLPIHDEIDSSYIFTLNRKKNYFGELGKLNIPRSFNDIFTQISILIIYQSSHQKKRKKKKNCW